MAEVAEDAPAPPPKKSGGFKTMLINGAGIFVLALIAVVVGGFINAGLHPMPETGPPAGVPRGGEQRR